MRYAIHGTIRPKDSKLALYDKFLLDVQAGITAIANNKSYSEATDNGCWAVTYKGINEVI